MKSAVLDIIRLAFHNYNVLLHPCRPCYRFWKNWNLQQFQTPRQHGCDHNYNYYYYFRNKHHRHYRSKPLQQQQRQEFILLSKQQVPEAHERFKSWTFDVSSSFRCVAIGSDYGHTVHTGFIRSNRNLLFWTQKYKNNFQALFVASTSLRRCYSSETAAAQSVIDQLSSTRSSTIVSTPVNNNNNHGHDTKVNHSIASNIWNNNGTPSNQSSLRLSTSPNAVRTVSYDNKYQATITKNGSAVSIQFPPTKEFQTNGTIGEGTAEPTREEYHAAFLWLNDPSAVHATSGGLERCLGDFYSAKRSIVSIDILERHHDEKQGQVKGKEKEGTLVPRIRIPPRGSFYSVGGIHDTDSIPPTSSRPMLRVTWSIESTTTTSTSTCTTAKSAVSYYDMDWLFRCRASPETIQQQSYRMRITKDLALGASDNPSCPTITKIDYNDLMNPFDHHPSEEYDETVVFELLHGIMEHGAVLLQNAPPMTHVIIPSKQDYSNKKTNDDAHSDESNLTVAKVARALGGSLSHGALYGDIFHVISKANSNNMAYSCMQLPPHQDLAYYESKPFLQLLHCVQNHNVRGGTSTLIDSMAAAQTLYDLAPRYFDILKRCQVTFVKQRDTVDMVRRAPHIQVSTTIPNEVVGITWSPPFEAGPWLLPTDVSTEDFLMARTAFELMLDNAYSMHEPSSKLLEDACLEAKLKEYARQHTWEYQLQSGEILIFNNQRMLHGRRAFSLIDNNSEDMDGDQASDASLNPPNGGNSCGRHLIGCYTNVDETLSRYRTLLRKRQDRDRLIIRNVGNGSSGSP